MKFSLFQMLILLLIIFSVNLPSKANNVKQVIPFQSDYIMTLGTTDITINQNQGANITVTLTKGGSAVENAFFSFKGINKEFNLDIGESQYYLGNGVYEIVISENATINVPPFDYQVLLIATHLENTIEKNIQIKIVSIDTTSPTLNILFPKNFSNFDETIFKIILEGRDDIFWRDISINMGDLNIYYLKNPGNTTLDLPNIKYNNTYLKLDLWINLQTIPKLNSSNFNIVLRDLGFNTAIFGTIFTGDNSKPVIKWISHKNDDVITSRSVFLSWSVTDDSEITSQILKLNGKIFKPGGVSLTPSDRNISFQIPIPKDQYQILEFSLEVRDIYENWNEISLRLIYDQEIKQNNIFEEQINVDDNILVIIATIITIIFLFGISILGIKKYRGFQKDKIPKKFVILLQNRPDSKIYTKIISEDILHEINEILDENINKINSSDRTDIPFILGNIKTNLEYILHKHPEDEQIIDIINSKYLEWVNQLIENYR